MTLEVKSSTWFFSLVRFSDVCEKSIETTSLSLYEARGMPPPKMKNSLK